MARWQFRPPVERVKQGFRINLDADERVDDLTTYLGEAITAAAVKPAWTPKTVPLARPDWLSAIDGQWAAVAPAVAIAAGSVAAAVAGRILAATGPVLRGLAAGPRVARPLAAIAAVSDTRRLRRARRTRGLLQTALLQVDLSLQ